MIAIDTNLLVYSHWTSMPEHQAAISILEEASRSEAGWGIAATCVGEFWSVVTHPGGRAPSTPAEASAFLQGLWESGALQLEPKADFARRLLALAEDMNITGARIFDLQIALISFEAGAREIWTNDRGFPQIHGLRVRQVF